MDSFSSRKSFSNLIPQLLAHANTLWLNSSMKPELGFGKAVAQLTLGNCVVWVVLNHSTVRWVANKFNKMKNALFWGQH